MIETGEQPAGSQAPPVAQYAEPALLPRKAWWVRWVLPSVADVYFSTLLVLLTFGLWGPRLLGDADTGWHIRNGEQILSTRTVPHVDFFSYTMAGHAWYAWEWLYDALIAAVHSVAGLNGVVVCSAIVIALTFALLFRFAFVASGDVLIAAVLTLLAAGSASIHFLARPHLLTWLFTVVWFKLLTDHQDGRRKHLYVLPVTMLLWVNLHGGFLVGLALLAIAIAASLWTWSTAFCPKRRGRARERMRHLVLIAALTGAATLATPYSFKLYVHLRDYLGNPYLMDNISEFLAPNFHLVQAKVFAALLLVTIVALALNASKLRAFSVLTVCFSVWVGLYAARNIPLAAILLTLTIAPLLANALHAARDASDLTLAVRDFAGKLDAFAARMRLIEGGQSKHLLAAALALATVAISLNGGRVSSKQVVDLKFDAKQMPVAAAEYMAAHNIRDHFFSPDDWGGYLIYRLYPKVRLFVDDRHDFYGEPFLREYMKVAQVREGWRAVLDAYRINFVLVPADSPTATMLTSADEWRVAHQDATAVLFARVNPLPEN